VCDAVFPDPIASFWKELATIVVITVPIALSAAVVITVLVVVILVVGTLLLLVTCIGNLPRLG
jgi:hypothetical protein